MGPWPLRIAGRGGGPEIRAVAPELAAALALVGQQRQQRPATAAPKPVVLFFLVRRKSFPVIQTGAFKKAKPTRAPIFPKAVPY